MTDTTCLIIFGGILTAIHWTLTFILVSSIRQEIDRKLDEVVRRLGDKK